MLMLGMVTTLVSYGLFRIQDILPLRANMPSLAQSVHKNDVIGTPTVYPKTNQVTAGGKVPGIIAFVQSISFATNTDWQSYEPEQMFTHFSQLVDHDPLLFLFGGGNWRGGGAGPRRGAAADEEHRQFLARFDADHALPVYSDLPGLRPVERSAGHPDGLPALHRRANVVDESTGTTPGQTVTQTIVQGPIAAFATPKVFGLNGPGITGADLPIPSRTPRR